MQVEHTMDGSASQTSSVVVCEGEGDGEWEADDEVVEVQSDQMKADPLRDVKGCINALRLRLTDLKSVDKEKRDRETAEKARLLHRRQLLVNRAAQLESRQQFVLTLKNFSLGGKGFGRGGMSGFARGRGGAGGGGSSRSFAQRSEKEGDQGPAEDGEGPARPRTVTQLVQIIDAMLAQDRELCEAFFLHSDTVGIPPQSATQPIDVDADAKESGSVGGVALGTKPQGEDELSVTGICWCIKYSVGDGLMRSLERDVLQNGAPIEESLGWRATFGRVAEMSGKPRIQFSPLESRPASFPSSCLCAESLLQYLAEYTLLPFLNRNRSSEQLSILRAVAKAFLTVRGTPATAPNIEAMIKELNRSS
jgi:hypothetical protein